MATTPVRLSIDDLPVHLATLKAELEQGHTVELLHGDEIIAEVHARHHFLQLQTVEQTKERPPMPDFMARMKAIWGDRVFEDSTKLIREDRDSRF